MFAAVAWAVVRFVAVMVVSYFVNQALAPRQKNNTPEAVSSNDWNFPQIDEGIPQCVFLVIVGQKIGKFWLMVTIVRWKSKKDKK